MCPWKGQSEHTTPPCIFVPMQGTTKPRPTTVLLTVPNKRGRRISLYKAIFMLLQGNKRCSKSSMSLCAERTLQRSLLIEERQPSFLSNLTLVGESSTAEPVYALHSYALNCWSVLNPHGLPPFLEALVFRPSCVYVFRQRRDVISSHGKDLRPAGKLGIEMCMVWCMQSLKETAHVHDQDSEPTAMQF